jgi:hypothetical protein
VSDYVAAFDDSGGVESLANWSGAPIPGNHPLTTLSCVYIKRDVLPSFEADWNGLRGDIQKALNCPYPPPIHMRLMWGKDIARRSHRKLPNPYAQASFGQIKLWVRRAWEILSDVNQTPRNLAWHSANLNREIESAAQRRYFEHPEHLKEMLFLRRRSRGMYRKYHNMITSPLLVLLTQSLIYLNEQMMAAGNMDVACLVDPFGDSHGVDEAEVLETARSISRLQRITSIDRVEDSDLHPLCQAADLIGFTKFRLSMIEQGFMAKDIHLDEVLSGLNFKPFTSANVVHRIGRRYPNSMATALCIHFAVARNRIVECDPDFAERHIVDVDEFYRRAHQMPKGSAGVLILKD